LKYIKEGLSKMTSLYSLTAEVLTTRSLLNNDVRTAITTDEYDYNEDTRLP
jgi:hypothetical protein